jgi:hypothetical protein
MPVWGGVGTPPLVDLGKGSPTNYIKVRGWGGGEANPSRQRILKEEIEYREGLRA